MHSTSFFRDATLPSQRNERLIHERFLLDTYAERRATEKRAKVGRAFERLLARIGRRAQH